MLGGRIHDHRDERFTGSEDKNGEKNPGCQVGLSGRLVMYMGMFIAVMVAVVMLRPIGMEMDMYVRLVFYGAPYPPEKIREPETDEQPGGHASPKGLDVLQLEHPHTQGDSQEAQNHGTQDMAQAAEERHKQGLGQAPPTGAADHDEREVVVRTQQCVHKADGGGGAGDQHNFLIHVLT